MLRGRESRKKKDGRELGERLEVVYIWLVRCVRADGNAADGNANTNARVSPSADRSRQMHNRVWP
jgi:hypothetical protein